MGRIVLGDGLNQPWRGHQRDDLVLFGDDFMTEEGQLVAGLMDNFGVQSVGQLNPDQLMQDSDGDGKSDLDQIQAGNDPGLLVQIIDVTDNGLVLEWPCVDRKSYTLFRTDSLGGDFQPIAVENSSQNGFMTYTDTSAAGSGPYYYKVQKIDN